MAITEKPWPYLLPEKALKRWAGDCTDLTVDKGDAIFVQFRFLGSTCSNTGHPINAIFSVNLSAEKEGDRTILDTSCKPAPDDTGFRLMCSCLTSPESFLLSLENYKPPFGETLNEAILWNPEPSPSGCFCLRTGLQHKWRNAIQTIHYAISQQTQYS